MGESFYGNVINKPKGLGELTIAYQETEENTLAEKQENYSGDLNLVIDLPLGFKPSENVNDSATIYHKPANYGADVEGVYCTKENSININPGQDITILSTRIEDIDFCGHLQDYVIKDYNFTLIGGKGTKENSEIFNDYANNKASGEYSHAEGYNTKANGNYTHVGGSDSEANGNNDFMHGDHLISSSKAGSHRAIFGRYNELDDTGEKKFQLGAGTGEDNRKDLFYITDNGAYCPDFIANNEIKLSETKISFTKSQDGKTYKFKQGEKEIGEIEVALNAMVNKAEIVEQDNEGNIGTFIKLTVNTENNIQETLYINVSQIAFNPMIKDSSTIDMAIGQDKLLSAEIRENSIEDKHILSVNGSKISNDTISNSKLVDKTIKANKIDDSAFKDLAKSCRILIDTGFFHMNPVSDYKLIANTNGYGGNIGSASLGFENEVYCETSVALGAKNIIEKEPANCFCSGVIAAGRLNTARGNGVAAIGLNNKVDYINWGQEGGSIGLGAYNEISQIEQTGKYQNLTGALALGSHNLIKNNNVEESLQGAIALGYENESKASGAIAAGLGTIATNPGSFVGGKYNLQDENKEYIAIIGNGQDSTQRSNAFTLNQNGNGWFAGEVETDRVILRSSTPNSNKKFALSINDEGVLSIQEV